MADHSTQAKQARETLARALGALQSDPTVPPSLMDVAEPVAMAMGALHGIERTGALTTAPEARDHVRAALGKLQAQAGINHPAIDRAMEAVAESLGVIFGLVRANDAAIAAGAPAAAGPVAAAPAAAPAPAAHGAPPGAAYAPTGAAPAYAPPQPPPQPAAFQPGADPFASGAPTAPAVPATSAYAPTGAAPAYAAPPHAQPASPTFQPAAGYQAHDAPAPTAFHPAAAAPPPPPPVAPAPPQVAPQLAPKAASSDPFAAPAKPGAAARPDGGTQRFEAALGISSSTNFYKGLSGNDVIEHGGLFVATYNKVPPVGSPVALRVILPGGFEFESMATVVWTRENSGQEAPGFGARFTQINAEAKQLVYRYVRNREPLFYDDL